MRPTYRDGAIEYRETEVSRIANMRHRSDPSGEWTADDSREYQRDVLAMLRRELSALAKLARDASVEDVLRACGFNDEQIAARLRAIGGAS